MKHFLQCTNRNESYWNIKVEPVEAHQTANAISETFQSCHDQVLYWFIEVALYAQIFSLVSPFIAPLCMKLTLQDELILVLVKLRLNPPFQDLASQMEVSISTAKRMFHKLIDAMKERMRFLIKWTSFGTPTPSFKRLTQILSVSLIVLKF